MSIVLFWVSLSMLMIFLISGLYYAYNILKIKESRVKVHALIATPEGPTHIHDSKKSETVVFLKIRSCVKISP